MKTHSRIALGSPWRNTPLTSIMWEPAKFIFSSFGPMETYVYGWRSAVRAPN